MLPSEILDELMAHNKAVDDIEKIVIYGYCTDICVISNAMVLRAAFPETEIEIRGHAPVPPNGAGRHAGVPVHNRIKRIKAKLKPTHSCVSHRIVLYFTP